MSSDLVLLDCSTIGRIYIRGYMHDRWFHFTTIYIASYHIYLVIWTVFIFLYNWNHLCDWNTCVPVIKFPNYLIKMGQGILIVSLQSHICSLTIIGYSIPGHSIWNRMLQGEAKMYCFSYTNDQVLYNQFSPYFLCRVSWLPIITNLGSLSQIRLNQYQLKSISFNYNICSLAHTFLSCVIEYFCDMTRYWITYT